MKYGIWTELLRVVVPLRMVDSLDELTSRRMISYEMIGNLTSHWSRIFHQSREDLLALKATPKSGLAIREKMDENARRKAPRKTKPGHGENNSQAPLSRPGQRRRVRWRGLHDYFRTDPPDGSEFWFTIAKWESRDDIVELYDEAVYRWAHDAVRLSRPPLVDL